MNSKNQSQYSNMSQQTAEQSAVKTLERLGYTYHGGTQWKPPLGKSAEPLLDRITELQAQLQQYQWQPIETAPKDGTEIIIYFKSNKKSFIVTWNYCGAYWMLFDTKEKTGTPSHWMPLPAAPAIAEVEHAKS